MVWANTEGNYCGRKPVCIVMVEENRLRKDMEKLWIITADDRKEDKANGTGDTEKNQ